ncbi:hypothetical protein ACFQJC_14405 [Haloferax namakaokahaiae]|uniref:Uncharacterized protein n=1 Tax=Haloferax namakaokahaiae TaxID=1748331 RepID=A0ABD5ZHG6_9EURY
MSATTTQSDGYAPESQPFIEWSDFNENREKYTGIICEEAEPDIWNPDTQNATTIRYDIDCIDGSLAREKFKRLSQYNTGLRVGRKWTNDRYNTNLLNRHLIQALASQLDLNPRFQREAERLFLSLDLSRFGIDARAVAYTVCMVVVHSSEDNTRACHPSVKDVDSEFERIAECEGFREGSLISLYNKVAQSGGKFRG